MFNSSAFFVTVAVTWLAIGVTLAIVMGRRGHSGFGWLVMGTLLGPLGVILALDAGRHGEQLQPLPITGRAPVTQGAGPVDVLVGSDGSPESAAAMDAAVALLGERLGRLTLATVVPFGDIRAAERQAMDRLRVVTDRTPGKAAGVEILHGHPSAALRRCAVDGGYELIAVGTRGRGLTKAILGSAATELARDSQIPVLLVGERQG